MSKIELPIFSDNLRSSASWNAQLAYQREAWMEALKSGDTRHLAEVRLRDQQVEHIRRWSGIDIDEQRLRRATGMVSEWAKNEADGGKTGATLNTGRLLDLHRVLIGATEDYDPLRRTEPLPISALHDPTPAILLPRMLDNAFDWFTTPSFGELHPVEQATIVYLRLLDLYPFPSHTEMTALMAASFYTERAGLPPLIIYTDDEALARYGNALDTAFRMLTQPLVEFFAEMLALAMRRSLSIEP